MNKYIVSLCLLIFTVGTALGQSITVSTDAMKMADKLVQFSKNKNSLIRIESPLSVLRPVFSYEKSNHLSFLLTNSRQVDTATLKRDSIENDKAKLLEAQ